MLEPCQTAMKRSLERDLIRWTRICSGTNHDPSHYRAHRNVTVNYERSTFNIDLLAVVKWNDLRYRDIFIVKILTALDKADLRWTEYLRFGNYFLYALPNHDRDLRKAIETRTEAGMILVDLEDADAPVKYHRHQFTRIEGDGIGSIYQILYERLLNWGGD